MISLRLLSGVRLLRKLHDKGWRILDDDYSHGTVSYATDSHGVESVQYVQQTHPIHSSVADAVLGVIEDMFEILPFESLDKATRLDEDLELDQLERVNFALYLEDMFELVEIPDDIVDDWKTVGEVIKYVENAVHE